MPRTILGLIGLSLALVLITSPPLPAETKQSPQGAKSDSTGQPEQPQPKPQELPPFSKFSKTPEIIKRLQTEIETKYFQEPEQLQLVLDQLQEQLTAKKKDVPILVDEEAFKSEMPVPKTVPSLLKPETPPKAEPSLMETLVKLPPLPKKISVETALHIIIGQLPKVKGTYLIRNGTVVITTAKRAGIKSLLQEKVTASFHEVPLYEALYKLSDQTGASINFDPNTGKKFFQPVWATFAHDTTLDSALTILTDAAGLRPVVVGDGIYITTIENADKLRYLPK